MSKIKHIYLVRHGESQGNVDPKLLQTMPDHKLQLSDRGLVQATETGHYLAGHVHHNCHKLRIWHSPYDRARQTANAISQVLSAAGQEHTKRESILICEQQFGLFDGLSKKEVPERYPAEAAHYQKCLQGEGRFWARPPLGESRFDVVQRVHQFMGTLYRDLDSAGIDSVIIVAHGITNRAFAMQWLHHPFEWFEAEPNPANGSVRGLLRGRDKGTLFTPKTLSLRL
jgi:2,3-bisphosphoglycerate-dependent phosphoglycerate mutase